MVLKTTVKEVEDKVKESSNAPHAQESKEWKNSRDFKIYS
jgi:hypothetical protein